MDQLVNDTRELELPSATAAQSARARELLERIEDNMQTERDESAMRELRLARIRCLIALGRMKEAEEEACTLTTDSQGEVAERLIARLDDIAATLEARRHKAQADAVLHMTRTCVGAIPDLDTRYRVLLRTFYRGKYELVATVAQAATAQATQQEMRYRLSRLRARAMAAMYWRMYDQKNLNDRSPTAEEAAALRDVSRRCTRAYEDILQESPDPLAKVRAAAEWWCLNANRYFKADSLALRAVLRPSEATAATQSAASIDAMTAQWRRHIDTLLDKAAIAGQTGPQQRTLAREALTQEFKALASLGLGQWMLDSLLPDMASFLGEGFPLAGQPSDETLERTLRWYLWIAVVRELPDEIERQQIQQQVESLARVLEEELGSVFGMSPEDPLSAKVYADRIRNSYKQWVNRPFLPFYRRALLAHEMTGAISALRKKAKGLAQAFDEAQRRGSRRPEVLRSRRQLYLDTAYALTLHLYLYYDKPLARYHMRDRRVTYSRGSVDMSGPYRMSIGAVASLPDYDAASTHPNE